MHQLLVRSVQEHPELPPLALTATNPIALRRASVRPDDASLLRGVSLDMNEARASQLPAQILAALQTHAERLLQLFYQFDDE